ncbi:C6 transcription factor [Colletotrichum scovillei]|uniref:C6 transcription factor n=2 Tax=Colletotrichum scovillei TaxID=1209932 RepID=A0A9P7QW84_9PEZI|nr:C6 transcription factor [Colletotrichum scovillei]KAG7043186.1 C6 transcription factor [Colletotrichum scovillei]KAG7062633.1 C6 transcription factor [Colletotrichum scovillei]
MVNNGRPSKYCFPCRKRKLRCDLAPGGCGQCRRAKLSCHGYRDSTQLLFRDETKTTASKVSARLTAAAASRSHVSIRDPPHLTWEDISRDTFLSLYVVGLSHTFDTLPALLNNSPPNGHLHISLGAAGLAFMSFHLNRHDLLLLASKQYVAAIRSIRSALSSTSNSNSHHGNNNDEVIQSALLLDLYEKIADRHEHQSASWLSHARGALHMVCDRANTDFSNPTTCQLANNAAVALMKSCGIAGVPVPPSLLALREDLNSYVRDAKWSFTGLVVGIVNLRAYMQGLASGAACPNVVLRRAKILDEHMTLVEKRLQRSWKATRTFTVAYNPLIFGRYYDVYPSHHATQVTNAVRMMRLELNSIIQHVGHNEEHTIKSQTREVIRELTRHLCAAVPQFLLLIGGDATSLPVHTLPPLQRLHCCTMLTPLYLSFCLTEDLYMKEWILQILLHMAEHGVKLASDVFQLISSGKLVDYWALYAMVGSYAIAA